MDKIGSAILDSEESDYYNKLRSFVIKLSDKSIKQAQALTDQFRNQSFHANLIKMIRYFRENLLNEYNRKEHTKLKTQYKILQNQLKQLNSQKDPNLQTIQDNVQKTLNFIKVNSMQEAYELSQKYDITYIKDLLSQVRQYRWLKSYTFSNSQIPAELQFTSLKGQQLKTFVKSKVDVLKQVNEFFLTEIDNIKNSRPPQSQLPSHIFSQQARKLHEQLLAHFRQIRTQIKNRQQDLRGTIKSFMRQLELDIDEKQNDEATFLQEFLQKLRKRLLKKRQAVLFERQKQKNENLLIKSCRSQILSQNKDIMMNSFMKPKRDTLKMLKRPSLEQNKIIIPIDEIKNIINQYKEKLSLVPIEFKEIKCSTAYEELKYVCGNISKALNYYKDQTADLEQKLNSQREEADQQRKKHSTKDRELIMQGNNNQWNIIQSIKGQQYAEYQNRINQLNQLVKQLRNQNENFQQQLKLNKLQLQFKQLQLSNLKTQKFNISNLSTAAISIQQHVQNIQYTDINQLQKLLKQKDNELQSLKRYYTSQKNRLKQKHEQKLASEKIRYRKLAQEIDELNDKIDKINNMYLQRLEYDISKTPQPRRVQARQLAIQTDNQNLVTSISFQKKESRNQHQLSQDTNHNDSFSFQSINLFDSTKRINLSQLNDERESFQSKIRTLQFKVDIYESHIQRLQTFYDSVIMKKDVELNHLREIAQTLKKDKNQLTIKLHKSQIKQITHNEINLHNLHLFPAGGIFQYYNYQQRLFLIQRLTARLGKIQLTRLIYRTDNYNKTNFHRYVDGYRNIVVIIKTVLGKLIAGYSEQAFNSKGIVPGYGMILSLWKKKAYELRDKRAITYDDYYLIFGNSEIRLRSLEFKLFSNFGISNSFYDSRGDKVHELLGEGNERDVNITGFEVYALELED